jgi:hypothetical protein
MRPVKQLSYTEAEKATMARINASVRRAALNNTLSYDRSMNHLRGLHNVIRNALVQHSFREFL